MYEQDIEDSSEKEITTRPVSTVIIFYPHGTPPANTKPPKQYEEEEEAGQEREGEMGKPGEGGGGSFSTEEEREAERTLVKEKSEAVVDGTTRTLDEEQNRHNDARAALCRQTLNETYQRLLRAGLIGPGEWLE